MLDVYIYYFAWLSLISHIVGSIISGHGVQSSQTTRVVSALLSLPLIGRLLGWW